VLQGRFFKHRAKAEGKKPTLRQVGELRAIVQSMGKTFVIAEPDSPAFDDLRMWLDELTWSIKHDPHISQDPVSRRPV
jgi:hypothetical protein